MNFYRCDRDTVNDQKTTKWQPDSCQSFCDSKKLSSQLPYSSVALKKPDKFEIIVLAFNPKGQLIPLQHNRFHVLRKKHSQKHNNYNVRQP